MELRADGEELILTIYNKNLGHAFPDGASFLLRLSVQLLVDEKLVQERFLCTRLRAAGEPVFSPNLADEQFYGSVPAGQSREMRIPVSAQAELCWVFQSVEPGCSVTWAWTDLAGPEHRVLCVSP